jgi:hypothetical protein
MIAGSQMLRIWRMRILCLFTERAVSSFLSWAGEFGTVAGGWNIYDTRGRRP